MKWLGVFFAMAALDYVWALYTQAVTDKKPYAAAWSAVTIFLCSGVVTVGYVHDLWLLIPGAAGAYFGTYAAVVDRPGREPAGD